MQNDSPKITILFPKLDVPNKKVSSKKLAKYEQSTDVVSIRSEWAHLLELLKEALANSTFELEVIIKPMWEFTKEYIESIDSDLLLIPHKNRFEIGSTDKAHVFYMQVMTKWLFSFDTMGWSAGSSEYPCKNYESYSTSCSTLQKYRQRLFHSNSSKFSQKETQSKLKLILTGKIPYKNYIFFPCQIPHDHSIEYFSDFSEYEVIESLTQWANKKRIHIVFKKHPANTKAMTVFEPLVNSSKYCRWSDASIFDLITHSLATYTINSGVGFESLLLNKPVATFGNVEYDQLTVKATPTNLDKVYAEISNYSKENLEHRFSKFLNWFSNDYCIDLTLEKDLVLNRLVHKMECIFKQTAKI